MPSKKIFSLLIVCVGIITAVWLIDRRKEPLPPRSGFAVVESRPNLPTNSDWQDILIARINTASTSIIMPSLNSSYPNEGSVTDQMAKDFFSQYLIAQKNSGGELSEEQIQQITQNTLSNPTYTAADGPKYTAENLRISKTADNQTTQTYYNRMKDLSKWSVPAGTPSEIDILNKAIEANSEAGLVNLDPIIASYRSILKDMLDMTVPADAVEIHLADVNAVSNVLSNIESMRVTFRDPVKAFAAITAYYDHALEMSIAIKKTINYFEARGFTQ